MKMNKKKKKKILTWIHQPQNILCFIVCVLNFGSQFYFFFRSFWVWGVYEITYTHHIVRLNLKLCHKCHCYYVGRTEQKKKKRDKKKNKFKHSKRRFFLQIVHIIFYFFFLLLFVLFFVPIIQSTLNWK